MAIDNTLPETAAVRHPTTQAVVIVKRGERGFYELINSIDPNAYNEARGITPAQREAMLTGSIFGFDVPGARAAAWATRQVPVTI